MNNSYKKCIIIGIGVAIIGFIVAAAFLFVLDVEKSISKTYNGVYYSENSGEGKKGVVILDGTITYEARLLDNIKSFYIEVDLVDEEGNHILDAYTRVDSINGGQFEFSSGLTALSIFNEDTNDMKFIGNIKISDDLEEVEISLYDGSRFVSEK